MPNQQLPELLASYQSRVQATFASLLGEAKNRHNPLESTTLHDAMAYSLTNGGKRVRPTLVYASALAVDPSFSLEKLDYLAAAVEMMHCYSLVHDDLPAMDDDDLRRGQPTCHKAYDEATAILVGDALQTLGFELVAGADFAAEKKVAMFQIISKALGARGMVLGQSLDIESENKKLKLDQLAFIHAKKTGELIRASVGVGAVAVGGDAACQQALDDYARHLGLAFQIQDDILDVESDTAVLGKKQGADADLNKSTYPVLMGLEAAKLKAHQSVEQAKSAIDGLSCTDTLCAIADFVITRKF